MGFKKLGAEFILTAIFLPCLAVIFIWIIDLQKADAVQETKLDQIRALLEEVRSDVKTIKEK
jgi:hypothetical protein